MSAAVRTTPAMKKSERRHTDRWRLLAYALAVFALLFAVYPTLRCFSHAEILYNEGWNVYNAQTVAAGGQLYPATPTARVVNYPALSFVVMAGLHWLTGHWLVTARLVSLLSTFACTFMVGLILRALGAGRFAAWMGAVFALAVFCISATAYVGVDDPQMFAEAVFLFAFLVYVRRDTAVPTFSRVAVVAVLFVIAGCIKHSPLEFPFAVFVDLLFLSLASAGAFALCGGVAAAIAVALNIHFGGPGFLSALLLQRDFSAAKSFVMFVNFFGPLLIPLCLAAWCAARLLRDPRRRVLALLLFIGLGVGAYFEGGSGVFVNVWFGAVLAVAMLCGWAIHLCRTHPLVHVPQSALACVLLAWLVIPSITEQVWNPVRLLHERRHASTLHLQDLATLRSLQGPALCESLLLCAQARKPYIYDPFNATRLMNSGKLPQQPLLDALRQHWFAAVQLYVPPPGNDQTRERFPAAVLQAIEANYRPLTQHANGVIYVPAR